MLDLMKTYEEERYIEEEETTTAKEILARLGWDFECCLELLDVLSGRFPTSGWMFFGTFWKENHDFGFDFDYNRDGRIRFTEGVLYASESLCHERLKLKGISHYTYTRKASFWEKKYSDTYKFRENAVIHFLLKEFPENLYTRDEGELGSMLGMKTISMLRYGDDLDYVRYSKKHANQIINKAWEIVGRIPKEYDLVGEGDLHNSEIKAIVYNILALKNGNNMKKWLKRAKKLGNSATHEKLALLFIVTQYSEQSLTMLENKFKTWTWENIMFDFRNIPDNRVKLALRSEKVRDTMKRIPFNVELTEKMTSIEILQIGSRYVYENVINEEVAELSAMLNLPQNDFLCFQEYWLTREHADRESIPHVLCEREEFRMFRLNRNDPRGPVLGLLTDCCQHIIGGAGVSCALHGTEDSNGAFFIIEKYGKVIAQSWAWRYNDTLVFDSIETKQITDTIEVIRELYQKTSDKILGRLGINRVHVGSGYGNETINKMRGWERTEPVPTPPGYSDASIQYKIAERRKS